MRRCRSCGSTRLRSTAASVRHLLVLVLVACLLATASAIVFDAIQAAPHMGSVNAWETSVQAIKALELAIDDDDVHREVQLALQNVSSGFLPCLHNVYRCDAEGTIVEVVIDELTSGRVDWAKFPATVRRVYVRNSALEKSLVLTALPRQLEEFTAVSTRWAAGSILVHPFEALRESGAPLTPCGPDGGKDCVFALHTLRCEGCELTAAYLAGAAALFPRLAAINLNSNPLMSFDVRSVPPSVLSLQVSHARLGPVSVAEVLASLPPQIELLNLSYTEVRFEWAMLQAVSHALRVLDLSGLAQLPEMAAPKPGGDDDEKRGAMASTTAAPLRSSICGGDTGFSPVELYLSHCGIAGGLPSLRACTRLAVLEVSHNKLTHVQLEELPASLEVLHLNDNAFPEVVNVSLLPRGLRSLDLSSNRFTGSIRVADLPEELAYLDVSNNAFGGTVNLTELPESVKFVYLQHNNFTGEADLVDIPLGIRFIMIHHNNWDYRLPAP